MRFSRSPTTSLTTWRPRRARGAMCAGPRGYEGSYLSEACLPLTNSNVLKPTFR